MELAKIIGEWQNTQIKEICAFAIGCIKVLFKKVSQGLF